MGLLLGLYGKITTLRSINSLNYKLELMTTVKRGILNQINDMVGLDADMDSESPEYKEMTAKKERLQQAENALEIKMQELQTQLQYEQELLSSYDEMISNAIQRSKPTYA